METIITWLESHQLTCFFKSMVGVDCPGCGFQRSFILLLKGELGQSLNTYPPLMLIVTLMMLVPLHLIFRFRNGGTFIKYYFLATLGIVVANFICRLAGLL